MKWNNLILLFLVFSCSNPETKTETLKEKKILVNTNEDSIPKKYNPAEGLAEGEHTTKYPNGTLQVKGEVLQGKRHGIWTTWRPNGMKWSENTYNLGVLEGKTVSYYENGQVHYIGYYKNDEKEGKWIFFNEEGEQIKEEVFK